VLVDMLAPFARCSSARREASSPGKEKVHTQPMIVLSGHLPASPQGFSPAALHSYYYLPCLDWRCWQRPPCIPGKAGVAAKGGRRLVAASGPACAPRTALLPSCWEPRLIGRTPRSRQRRSTAQVAALLQPGEDVAAYITAATNGRAIYVWASEPELYLCPHAGRQRFIYDYPLQLLPMLAPSSSATSCAIHLRWSSPTMVLQPADWRRLRSGKACASQPHIEGYDLWTRPADQQP
jgi:hypothetical protein